ncbi:peroxisomal fatty acid beta-oxidation multifunctional AIM1-like [Brachionus plicatilis]|uniref:Peroxisomal fatty acid beta-oxidation multifunctional AIM1-like n=1 Tax=Brachionus plicatilis TaxID=10195 RepID=A0A3M7Q3L9_BRAPC|nr:peroxisomal fatty acid beta-oxidation multifunctional AIM1-like [Brachionus plicatilis]
MVRVAVIGCGLLGIKIAGEFAYHGHRVKCYDNNIQALNSVFTKFQADKAQLYDDHVIESPDFTGRILCLSRLEETVNDAQLVVECVIEDFDIKSVLLGKISSFCPNDAIIVTSTLRLDLAKLAENVSNKARFAGLRFLYPVYYIPEVEFTPIKDTENMVMERLRAILGQMGKTLFFRSGSEPLILTEEKRELRKQQRVEDLRLSSGLPPVMMLRQDSNAPELSRSIQSDLYKIFIKKNQNQDFHSIQNDTDRYKKSQNELSDENKDNDCAICMDMVRNSVLRPCNHMITCFDCSNLLFKRSDNCPICREKIEDVIKIFMS